MRASLSVLAVLLCACALRAQPALTEPDALPGGTPVSQPLTPVGPEPGAIVPPARLPEPPVPKPDPETPTPKPDVQPVPPERVIGPLGPAWHDLSLLYWWPMRQPIPALAVGARTGALVPGAPNSRVLLGGQAIDSEPSAGGRFTFGTALNSKQTVGYEISYLFLGTRSFWDAVRGGHGGQVGSLGVPLVNPDTGAPEVLVLARPDGPSATLAVSSAVRVQGWEVNALSNLYAGKYLKLNSIVGWRYFQLHEGVGVHTTQIFGPTDPQLLRSSEQFDAHNRFHGGQIGLHADARRGNVFCELTGKVAFGQNYEVVRSEGMTILYGPSGTRSFGGTGLFVQPSSFGRTANGTFAVLPEGTIKLGVRLGESGRLYVGYSFLYLSDVVRPGDQIDRTMGLAQAVVGGNVQSVERPTHAVQRTDVWVQGVVVGFEARF